MQQWRNTVANAIQTKVNHILVLLTRHWMTLLLHLLVGYSQKTNSSLKKHSSKSLLFIPSSAPTSPNSCYFSCGVVSHWNSVHPYPAAWCWGAIGHRFSILQICILLFQIVALFYLAEVSSEVILFLMAGCCHLLGWFHCFTSASYDLVTS